MSDLKKHIYKKFYNESVPTETEINSMQTLSQDWQKIKKGEKPVPNIPLNFKAKILMDSGKMVSVFPFNNKGIRRMIPEPDPILIYFHTAYVYYTQIEIKRSLVIESTAVEIMTENIINDLYDYYGLTCSFIIFLFTSLEAFINRSIPDNYKYIKTDNPRRTEIYTKDQIQWLRFDEKMNKVIPLIKEKDFSKSHPNVYQHIKNLKEFRDNIVHTRESSEGHTPFDYLFKRSFQYNYKAALNAVKDFYNFYHAPDYIVECPCSKDW
jgi:hypothetical protein